MERLRVAEAAKGVGRPKVGGKFELVDQDGKTFTDGDMKGGFSLVSSEPRTVHQREMKGISGDTAFPPPPLLPPSNSL